MKRKKNERRERKANAQREKGQQERLTFCTRAQTISPVSFSLPFFLFFVFPLRQRFISSSFSSLLLWPSGFYPLADGLRKKKRVEEEMNAGGAPGVLLPYLMSSLANLLYKIVTRGCQGKTSRSKDHQGGVAAATPGNRNRAAIKCR